jgi:hypothetical protein
MFFNFVFSLSSYISNSMLSLLLAKLNYAVVLIEPAPLLLKYAVASSLGAR